MGQFYLPASYELLEYGFIFSDDNTAGLYDGNNVTIAKSSQYNEASNEFLMSFPEGSHAAICSYLIYDNAGSIEVIYSDHVNRYQAASGYTTGFENSNKPSYTEGSVDVDGVNWTLSNALIGNLSNDKYFDSKSVRTNDGGYLMSEEAFVGMTGLSVYGAYYGTESGSDILVEVSADGTNWIVVSDALANTSLNADLTLYEISLENSSNYNNSSISGETNLYVRITGSIANGGDRANFDNFSVLSGISEAFLVTYHDYDGSSNELVTPGGYATMPDEVSREGYEFDGWFYDEALSQPVDFENDQIMHDENLYAGWSALPAYTVSYYQDESASEAFSMNLVYENYSVDSLPAGPDRSGENLVLDYYYTLDGDTEVVFDLDSIITSDIDVFAKWVETGSATSSATFTYGNSKYTSSATDADDYFTFVNPLGSDIDASSIVINKSYWSASGDNTMRLGSSSTNGDITYTFSNITITSISITALYYDSGAEIVVNGGTPVLLSGTATSYDFDIVDGTSFTIAGTDRLQIVSVTIYYTGE